MIDALARWWHRHQGHEIFHRRVSVPAWDRRSTGDLWRCNCGRTWVR